MLQQKDILEWLQKFSINQIKHFLTIKNPLHLDYLRKIITYKPDTKPKQRMEHGYSENKINNETTIYQRDKFRYKKNKEQKKEMDEVFFENITVSRQNPWSLSVTKSFIRNGKLSECMLLLSDGQVFSYIQYPLIKSGSQGQSFWFKTSNISSFSEWVIHFFQMEILEAYRNHEAVTAINPFVFADQCLSLTIVKESLIQVINQYTDKSNSGKGLKSQKRKDDTEMLEISKEESGYLLQKCLQKFQQGGRDIGEVIFQYEWISGNRTSKINKVLQKLTQTYMSQYHSYEIDCKVKEIEDLTTSSKKKKKKSKKTKESKDDKDQNKKQQTEIQDIKKQTPILKSTKKEEEIMVEEQKLKMEENKQKKQITPKKLSPNVKKNEAETNRSIQQPVTQNLQKQLKILKQKQLQQICKSKKLIQQRINELINFYYFKLYESSAALNKYRQVCIEMIKTEILSIQIPCIQQLVLFGSYSIDFAIKQSDLDFVLIIDEKASPEHIIYQLKDHLKATKWLRNCSIIEGKILSILQFQIMLSQIELPKLKDNKKLINTTIHVDLTVTNSKDNQCLRNTYFMKNLLEQYSDLKVIGLILKELLKITDLNKNYTGGIGSYTLLMLAYNVLKAKTVAFDGNYINQLTTIAKFMAHDFVPYETLVSSRGNSELRANPQMALNVEDPQSGSLLKTNAKRINFIVKLFTELYSLLDNTQAVCLKIGMEERKKMKRSFFQEWNRLFKPEKQLFEALQ